jgi:hypothetical protein
MARHGFIHVCVGIDDLEESKGILVDVDAAELSDFVGCISDETDEVAAEVSVNLRSVDVGKVVKTWSHVPEGGNHAGANTSEDMAEVLCGKKVVGLVRRAGEVAPFGVKFGVMGSRSAHAVDEASVKEVRLCQTLLPFFVMIEKRRYVLP